MIVPPKRYFLRTVPRVCCVHTYASVHTMSTLMPQLLKRLSCPPMLLVLFQPHYELLRHFVDWPWSLATMSSVAILENQSLDLQLAFANSSWVPSCSFWLPPPVQWTCTPISIYSYTWYFQASSVCDYKMMPLSPLWITMTHLLRQQPPLVLTLRCFKYFHELVIIFPCPREPHWHLSLCQGNYLQLLPKLLI